MPPERGARLAWRVAPALGLLLLLGCTVPERTAALSPTMTTLTGKPVTLKDYQGRVVLLDVWATWCVPCIKDIPRIQSLQDRYEPKGLTVLGVSLDEEGAARVRPFVRKHKMTYPILLDLRGANSVRQVFNIEKIPTLILLDASGKTLRRWEADASTEDIEIAVIDALRNAR